MTSASNKVVLVCIWNIDANFAHMLMRRAFVDALLCTDVIEVSVFVDVRIGHSGVIKNFPGSTSPDGELP